MVHILKKVPFYLSLIFIISCLSNCGGKHPKSPSLNMLLNDSRDSLLDIVQVIDSKRLKEGGSLYIIPFLPGPGVEANTEVNKIALMVIKGITEKLQANQSSLKVLSLEDARQSEIAISGYVSRLAKPRGLKKWIHRQDFALLQISGKMMDRKTGKMILHFAIENSIKKSEGDQFSLGYELGCQIGESISQNLK